METELHLVVSSSCVTKHKLNVTTHLRLCLMKVDIWVVLKTGRAYVVAIARKSHTFLMINRRKNKLRRTRIIKSE